MPARPTGPGSDARQPGAAPGQPLQPSIFLRRGGLLRKARRAIAGKAAGPGSTASLPRRPRLNPFDGLGRQFANTLVVVLECGPERRDRCLRIGSDSAQGLYRHATDLTVLILQ